MLNFKKLFEDRAGNFGILTAIALPALLICGGTAVDVSNMLLARIQVQNATDAAALATASALAAGTVTTDTATQFGKDFVSGEMSNFLANDATALAAASSGTSVNVTKTANGSTGASYAVVVTTAYNANANALTRMLGITSMTIGGSSSTSSSTESKNALSMYLVLDRSGSMDEDTDTVNASNPTTCTKTNSKGTCTATTTNYYTKMESLKIAVADLMSQLKTADPNMIYVRTGGDSYNSAAQTPSPLAWGETAVTSYVNALTSSGTTNSAPAFTNAYNALTASTETAAHQAKTGLTPTKYIVFLTDGENNVSNADTVTKQYCDKARTDGIQVYTVALMAPTAGQALLSYCATSTSTYFDAEDADDLVAAFKAIGEKASAALTIVTK